MTTTNDKKRILGEEIIGITPTAGRRLLEREAKSQGMSFDELISNLSPTPEQVELKRILQEKKRNQDETRLNAVKEAIWNNTDFSSNELFCLSEAIMNNYIDMTPTRQQAKTLFMKLPADIIGQGITHGFQDSLVRASIFEYVESNLQELKESIATK